MVVEIPLTQGYVTLVDDEDAEAVLALRWHAHRERSLVYARATVKGSTNDQKLRLHRWLIDAPADRHVDHINRDTLDNRRGNLRLATNSQNVANAPPRGLYKGITPSRMRWRAQIRFQGKQLHIGCFATDVEAALAYDRKALELFGEFACINFPKESLES